MVREWVANPAGNLGLLLNSSAQATSDSIRTFASSEASDAGRRPRLVVTYTMGSSSSGKGDLNSDSRIDIADALLALRMAVGLVIPTTDAMLRGDVAPVNAIDGKITIQDVMTILSAASGRITL